MLAQYISLMMSRNTFTLHGTYTHIIYIYIYTCVYIDSNILWGSHRNHMGMGFCAFATPTHRPDHHSTTIWGEETNPNSSQAQPDGPLLMGTVGIHQKIPDSDTKLTPSLGLYYISSPLAMDKLIPVNSRAIRSPLKMSLLLEVERTHAVIIKPRLIFVKRSYHLSQNKTIDYQRQMHIQYLNRIVSTPYASSRQLTYYITDCSPLINSVFQKYLPASTQVRNILCLRDGCQNENGWIKNKFTFLFQSTRLLLIHS